MNNMRSGNNRNLLLIGLIVLVGALFLIPRLFNTGDTANDTTVDQQRPVDNTGNQPDPNINLGRLTAAGAVDRDGCPVESRSSFEPTEPIYVVAQNSSIPAGTSVFVRLYREGTPIEDAPEITADRDYNNTCVNFVFEPTGSAFDPGQYEAEFIVNGNQADVVRFEVR